MGTPCHYCGKPAKLHLVICRSNLEVAVGYAATVRQPACVKCAKLRAVDDPASPWYTERESIAQHTGD